MFIHHGRRRRSQFRRSQFRRPRDERGDVPGWVMICVMSAGLVAILTALAGPRLQAMLDQALSTVGG
jgi:hypothetical protein